MVERKYFRGKTQSFGGASATFQESNHGDVLVIRDTARGQSVTISVKTVEAALESQWDRDSMERAQRG